ncbi:YceI family protein [Streptomyces sp. M10(2022)]
MDPALAALTGEYTIDPAHSSIGFTVRHAMVTNVRGSFTEHEGTLKLDGADPANSAASIDIKIASVDTGIADRDGHLLAGDFFDVETFPS